MSTLQHVRDGLSGAWESLLEGWQKLYRRASGAITPFRGGGAEEREIARRSVGWGVMAAEVFDDADRVTVRLEAPGMDREDFDLQVVEDHLLVRGHKRIERERTEGEYRISECAYGSFERAVPLPEEVDADRASASYRRGVLRVELPKSGRRRRRRITVDVGG